MAGYTPLPFALLKGPTVAGMETCENWKEKHYIYIRLDS